MLKTTGVRAPFPFLRMQKITSTALLATLALSGGFCLFAQQPAPAASGSGEKVPPPKELRPRVSPHETINVRDLGGRGGPRAMLVYGRPYSKDPRTGTIRKIWGELVKWDVANRLGADEATLFATQAALEIQGKTIPPGAYTLYIVPSENGTSKLAFSSHVGKWGIPVDETKDVARFDLIKQELSSQVDQLTLALENDAATGGGVIKIAWETTQYSLPFAVKK